MRRRFGRGVSRLRSGADAAPVHVVAFPGCGQAPMRLLGSRWRQAPMPGYPPPPNRSSRAS